MPYDSFSFADPGLRFKNVAASIDQIVKIKLAQGHQAGWVTFSFCCTEEPTIDRRLLRLRIKLRAITGDEQMTFRATGFVARRGLQVPQRLLALALGIMLLLAAPGYADAATFFRTQSGKVRCFTSSFEQKVGGPAAVCETYADETNGSFPQAPPCSDGAAWVRCNIVVANTRGQLFWDLGDIPGANRQNDIVMSYGQTYRGDGWTVSASSDGTRITNDATGHGMFVSIFNVYGF